MRRAALVPAVFLCLAALVPSVTAKASGGVAGLNDCPAPAAYGDVHICSGEVNSWDGAPLDVDLTLPQSGTGDRHALIVMLHGFANNKHEWEAISDEGDNADKWHWNNHWFAERGFYVLTYTARGFYDDGTTGTYQPPTPAGVPAGCLNPVPPRGGSACVPNGTIHLKSREFEIRDTQWLSALVAQAYPDLDSNEVAVTGGSYGGGESWLQATMPVWDANSFVSPAPTPALPILHLQVVVPKYPWTDLAYSLAPNGHPGPFDSTIYSSSQGSPTDPTDTGQGNPFGDVKFSYVFGFFDLGLIHGIFETGTTTTTPSQEGPTPLPLWAGRALAGDPYDVAGAEDLTGAQIRRGLTEFRASFYQDDAWAAEAAGREVAIFSVSGWTDDLFPPVESFRQFKYLKSLDPLWPVEVAVADIGHPRAQNLPIDWHHLNVEAWGYLKEQIHGSHRQQTSVLSLQTLCGSQAAAGGIQQLTASNPEDLSSGTLTVDYATAGHLLNRKVPADFLTPDPADPDGLQTDPAFGSALLGLPGCRTSVAPVVDSSARYTGMSAPLDQPRISVGLGHVDLTYTLAGATTATLNARVWDVAPDGTALLMTRGTYRIDTPRYDQATEAIQLPLFGNQWVLQAGHKIRLDLTQVDYPTFLQSNSSGAVITFPNVQLVLPTREATNLTVAGAALP